MVKYKHQERHPQPVDGCFGCKALSLGWRIPLHMSAKADGKRDAKTTR
jgi:hypothetical protein